MKLKEARKKRKLTQEKLAEKLGITQAHVSQLETGARIPRLNIYAKIYELFGGQVKFKDFLS